MKGVFVFRFFSARRPARAAAVFLLCGWFVSCGPYFENFFKDWKEYSYTGLASVLSETSFTEEQEISLLRLYQDIGEAGRDCGKIQLYIEDSEIIAEYEKLYDLKKGFLFDAFMDFEYEKALVSQPKDASKIVALSVATVWKQTATLEELQAIIDQIRKCYPREY